MPADLEMSKKAAEWEEDHILLFFDAFRNKFTVHFVIAKLQWHNGLFVINAKAENP